MPLIKKGGVLVLTRFKGHFVFLGGQSLLYSVLAKNFLYVAEDDLELLIPLPPVRAGITE